MSEPNKQNNYWAKRRRDSLEYLKDRQEWVQDSIEFQKWKQDAQKEINKLNEGYFGFEEFSPGWDLKNKIWRDELYLNHRHLLPEYNRAPKTFRVVYTDPKSSKKIVTPVNNYPILNGLIHLLGSAPMSKHTSLHINDSNKENDDFNIKPMWQNNSYQKDKGWLNVSIPKEDNAYIQLDPSWLNSTYVLDLDHNMMQSYHNPRDTSIKYNDPHSVVVTPSWVDSVYVMNPSGDIQAYPDPNRGIGPFQQIPVQPIKNKKLQKFLEKYFYNK